MDEVTKNMLIAMFAVMGKEDITEVRRLASARRDEILTAEQKERNLQRRAAAEKREKELADREAWNRANLKPGDWILLEFDEERDKHAESKYGIVERVNRVNVRYKVVESRLRLSDDGSVRHWSWVVPSWASSHAHQVKFCKKVPNPNGD